MTSNTPRQHHAHVAHGIFLHNACEQTCFADLCAEPWVLTPSVDPVCPRWRAAGWPDDSIGRVSDGGALCDGHASLHSVHMDAKVDVRTLPTTFWLTEP